MNFVVMSESALLSIKTAGFTIHHSPAKQNLPLVFHIEKNLCKIH